MRFSAKVSSYYLTHIDIDISIEIKIINQCAMKLLTVVLPGLY